MDTSPQAKIPKMEVDKKNQIPELALESVLVKSETLPKGTETVQGVS